MIGAPDALPVTAGDKVSDVLARDEALVAVFVRHGPHFAKLRNRTLRRVMARLVTVEQAARTANVSVDQLVRDLNDALGFPPDSTSPSAPPREGPRAARSAAQRHPSSAPVIEIDVREDLRSGREPFSRIMSAVNGLRDREVLHLRAIFEPVPLFAVLGKRGFIHESEAHALDDWSAWFWRPPAPGASPAADDHGTTFGDAPQDDEHTAYLDVRGLTPPEPMTRTLVALASLSRGHTLVQINNRVPQFLLPVLVERGFAYEIDETRPDRVLLRISHAR